MAAVAVAGRRASPFIPPELAKLAPVAPTGRDWLLEVKYDGKAQPLQIVALDGVPTGSQDGKRQGTIVTQKDILVPPGGRAEFIVTMPTADVRKAEFLTKDIATGHYGDRDPQRTLATIQTSTAPPALPRMPKSSGPMARPIRRRALSIKRRCCNRCPASKAASIFRTKKPRC